MRQKIASLISIYPIINWLLQFFQNDDRTFQFSECMHLQHLLYSYHLSSEIWFNIMRNKSQTKNWEINKRSVDQVKFTYHIKKNCTSFFLRYSRNEIYFWPDTNRCISASSLKHQNGQAKHNEIGKQKSLSKYSACLTDFV